MRREGRRLALQVLYALDAGDAWDQLDEQFRLSLANLVGEVAPEVRELAESLCREVTLRRPEIDRHIEAASSHWRLARMSRIDRSILRLAGAELLGELGTPAAVVLDEAVELAKEFGTAESASFVNGVLDRLAKDLPPA
jgi:transcription antitermination protein NusB